MKRSVTLLCAVLTSVFLMSCGEKEPVESGFDLVLYAGQDYNPCFGKGGGSTVIKFTAGKDWSVKPATAVDWLTISPDKGAAGECEVSFIVGKNDSGAERSVKARLSCGIASKDISITQTTEEVVDRIEFSCPYHDFYLAPGEQSEESQTMTIKVSGAVKAADVTFSISDRKVGMIGEKTGVFRPIAPGRAIVTAADPKTGATATREVIVTDYSQCFGNDCADHMMAKYSRPTLCGTQGQSFDISVDDRYSYHFNPVLYTQNMAVVQVPTDGSPIRKMYLKYWGHGNNLSVERDGDDDYIWAECYGSCNNAEGNPNGDHYYFSSYQNSESIGRIKFTPDGYFKPEDCTEQYVYPNGRMMGACIDEENNQIAFEVKMLTGNGWKYVRVYDLDEVKNAPVIEYTTSADLWFGGRCPKGNSNYDQTTWLDDADPGAVTTLQHKKMTFKAHDVSKCTKLADICLNKLEGIDHIQSIELSHEKVYVYCGGTFGNKHNECLVRVLDFQGNSVVKFGTNCGTTADFPAFYWIQDSDAIKSAIGYGNLGNGNMETEGFQVKNGNIYMGFSPVVGGDGYHMWIFGYRL